ncbi:tetratricopeptide repeat protein [Solwaraspora sp. WMMD1047]|uniref:tetratricopeptide repeat protein n=1 Tax=Solwaraspora sp. WMMD1047 TaxID=3016102 RepID=UPI002416A79E|nr:tetratricopeptide repeat protein [Solwaraspora sp. WMMD1047]MDG4833154.1 tetratricopeptide repeat protein [Solwaraspora sp. WMMD1047]
MDDPRLSAEGELALARLALDEGDLTHAAGHLSGAIAYAPTMPEVHEVLAQLAARTGGGLDLFPLDHHPFIGTVVARAHLLAAAGQPAEGLELLAAATGHAPVADWAGVPWVGAPDLPGRLDPERLARVLMQICAGVPDPVPESDRGPLRPYLRLAEHAIEAYPHSGLLLGAGSALARRAGEIDVAVDWARRGVRHWPSKLAEVWLGYAYRSAGRTGEALAALHRAVEHDPDDLSVYADIAGTLADNGRLDEALRWTDRALARNPTFDCAVHTAHRLRYRRDGALAHLVALADFQRDHPDDSHEHSDLAECCHGQPWLSQLPAASEAVVAVLRRVLATDASPAGGRLRLTGLEPPSAMRALAATFPDLAVTVAEVAEPDLREPRRSPVRRLWRYHGTTAVPAAPVPSASAVERIRQLAHPAWPHPPAVYDAAVGLATVDLDDLLGLLVHPPEPPATPLGRTLTEHDPTLWVRSVQVWACLGLLHHRADEPWPDSTRRRVLLDLVWGIEDWTTEAALFALVTAGWVDPAARSDVAGIVAERLADAAEVARHRPVSIARSVAQLALATPGMSDAARDAARQLLAATDPPAGRAGWFTRLVNWLTGRRRGRSTAHR